MGMDVETSEFLRKGIGSLRGDRSVPAVLGLKLGLGEAMPIENTGQLNRHLADENIPSRRVSYESRLPKGL